MELETAELASPIGPLKLTLLDGRLCGLSFEERWAQLRSHLEKRFGRVTFRRGTGGVAAPELTAYFGGRLAALARIPVDPGGTPFQLQVWKALRGIPVGQTLSYRELARCIGRPAAVRAVATANATNPVAIVIPCHRVIHADGSISGYGGGVERKRWLLRHEASRRSFELRPAGTRGYDRYPRAERPGPGGRT